MDDSISTGSRVSYILISLWTSSSSFCLIRNPPLLGNSALVEEAVFLHSSLLDLLSIPNASATPACFASSIAWKRSMSSRESSHPSIKSWVSHIAGDSQSEPPGKPCTSLMQSSSRGQLSLKAISHLKYVPSCWVSLPTSLLLLSFPDFLVTSLIFTMWGLGLCPLHPRLASLSCRRSVLTFYVHFLTSSLSLSLQAFF